MFSVLFPMCCCSIKSYWVVLHCKILLIVLIICACELSGKTHFKTFYTTFVLKCDSTDKEQRFWFCRNEPVTPNTITNHSITKPPHYTLTPFTTYFHHDYITPSLFPSPTFTRGWPHHARILLILLSQQCLQSHTIVLLRPLYLHGED